MNEQTAAPLAERKILSNLSVADMTAVVLALEDEPTIPAPAIPQAVTRG